VTPSPLGLLRQACIECRACPLRDGAVSEVTPVFGRRGDTSEVQIADPDPAAIRLVIVGEAPGPQENTVGRPFIGPAGDILASLLQQAGIDTGKVWITNAVACWPHEAGKSGRALTVSPPPQALEVCLRRHMWPQIGAFPEARVILALGMTAAVATVRTWPAGAANRLQPLLAFRPGEAAVQLSDIRVHDGLDGSKVLVTYHPSYLARRGYKAGERADAHEDAAVVLKAFTAARALARAEP
jgi:uracil-DNA glycosylase family 4